MIGRSSQGRRGSNQSEKATPGEGKKEPQKLDLKDMPKASARTGHFGCRTAVGEGANMAGRGRARGPVPESRATAHALVCTRWASTGRTP